MEIIHFPDDERPARWRSPVLALGNFDGLHRGHMKIIERVARVASERALVPIVLTFDPHPTRIVRPDKAPPLLMTKAQKIEGFARAGMHGVAVVRFTPEIAHWDPETFVRTVLADWLRVGEVWVGANFLFGHDRTGDLSALRQLGVRYGFRTEKIDPVQIAAVRDQISSLQLDIPGKETTRLSLMLLAGRNLRFSGIPYGGPVQIDLLER